jgi:hypothetical protein
VVFLAAVFRATVALPVLVFRFGFLLAGRLEDHDRRDFAVLRTIANPAAANIGDCGL